MSYMYELKIMNAKLKLTVDQLQRLCQLSAIPFDSTDTLEASALAQNFGQDRAIDSLRFGVGMLHHGYNMIAIGPPGIGKQQLIMRYLKDQIDNTTTPSDWCYVHNFSDPQRPRILQLPAGTGIYLQKDMSRSISDLRSEMRAVFEGKEFHTKKQKLIDQLKRKQQSAISEAQQRAKLLDVAIIQTEGGFGVTPIFEDSVIDGEKFQSLSDDEQSRLRKNLETVSNELQNLLHQFNEWRRENADDLRILQRETAANVAKKIIGDLRLTYSENRELNNYFDEIETDVAESVDDFLDAATQGIDATIRRAFHHEGNDGQTFRRYHINVLVDRSDKKGTPIIFEDHPNYANLIGRVEHETQFGALVTNFQLIKPGALHKAIDGYLVIDALKILQQPFAWDALKRTLQSRQIRIESLGQATGLVTTVSLDPEPIPLGNTKIILTSDRMLYLLLATLDPEFLELFKVLIDFEEVIERQPETIPLYANLVASVVKSENVRPFDRSSIAQIIDYASRIAGDSERLSVHMRSLTDLIREADYWCAQDQEKYVSRKHVKIAIDAKRRRSGRIRDRLLDSIRRDDILISTSGSEVGQVNALSVFQMGEQLFGHPTRITARTRIGTGEIIDIERSVKLGGPIHSKGVLILTGFLGARYASETPLSLNASIVFEQSYGSIEGDSASLAELCALISSLADVKINQAIAVTGSINQHGQVQSVGGINEKIEGFFDICRDRGLNGSQGVIIPHANIKNLMLRSEVCQSVEAGLFSIYAVQNIDEAIEILTNLQAGERDDMGMFPKSSINGKAYSTLQKYAECSLKFARKTNIQKEDNEQKNY